MSNSVENNQAEEVGESTVSASGPISQDPNSAEHENDAIKLDESNKSELTMKNEEGVAQKDIDQQDQESLHPNSRPVQENITSGIEESVPDSVICSSPSPNQAEGLQHPVGIEQSLKPAEDISASVAESPCDHSAGLEVPKTDSSSESQLLADQSESGPSVSNIAVSLSAALVGNDQKETLSDGPSNMLAQTETQPAEEKIVENPACNDPVSTSEAAPSALHGGEGQKGPALVDGSTAPVSEPFATAERPSTSVDTPAPDQDAHPAAALSAAQPETEETPGTSTPVAADPPAVDDAAAAPDYGKPADGQPLAEGPATAEPEAPAITTEEPTPPPAASVEEAAVGVGPEESSGKSDASHAPVELAQAVPAEPAAAESNAQAVDGPAAAAPEPITGEIAPTEIADSPASVAAEPATVVGESGTTPAEGPGAECGPGPGAEPILEAAAVAATSAEDPDPPSGSAGGLPLPAAAEGDPTLLPAESTDVTEVGANVADSELSPLQPAGSESSAAADAELPLSAAEATALEPVNATVADAAKALESAPAAPAAEPAPSESAPEAAVENEERIEVLAASAESEPLVAQPAEPEISGGGNAATAEADKIEEAAAASVDQIEESPAGRVEVAAAPSELEAPPATSAEAAEPESALPEVAVVGDARVEAATALVPSPESGDEDLPTVAVQAPVDGALPESSAVAPAKSEVEQPAPDDGLETGHQIPDSRVQHSGQTARPTETKGDGGGDGSEAAPENLLREGPGGAEASEAPLARGEEAEIVRNQAPDPQLTTRDAATEKTHANHFEGSTAIGSVETAPSNPVQMDKGNSKKTPDSKGSADAVGTTNGHCVPPDSAQDEPDKGDSSLVNDSKKSPRPDAKVTSESNGAAELNGAGPIADRNPEEQVTLVQDEHQSVKQAAERERDRNLLEDTCQAVAKEVISNISAAVIRRVSIEEMNTEELPAAETTPFPGDPSTEAVAAESLADGKSLDSHILGPGSTASTVTVATAAAPAEKSPSAANQSGLETTRANLIELEKQLAEELAVAKESNSQSLKARAEAASITEDMKKKRQEAETFTNQIAKIKQQYEEQLNRTYAQSTAQQETQNSHASDIDWKQKAIDAMQEVARMKAEMEVQLQQIRREQEQLRINQVETTVKDAQVSCSCTIC